LEAATAEARQKVFDKAKLKIDQFQEKYDSLKEQYRAVKEQLEGSNGKVTVMESQLTAVEKDKRVVEERCTSLTARVALMKQQLGNLLQVFRVSVVEDTDMGHSAALTQVIEKFNVMSTDMEVLRQESASWKSITSSCRSETEKYKSNADNLQRRVSECERLLSEAKDLIGKKEAALMASKAETQSLSSALAKLTIQATSTSSLSVTSTRLEGNDGVLEDLRKEVAVLKEANAKLRGDCDAQRAANRELLSMITELTGSVV